MATRGARMSLANSNNPPSKLPRSSGVYNRRQGSLGPTVPPRPSLPRAGRPSLSGHRQSNIHLRGPTQARQDPRPINDKLFQKECMLRLVEFLTTRGFTGPISSKLPSGREIRDIIEFLFRQVDANVVLGKLEDEVPAFFRNIGYPFQISKSALYAAGSPHSWPGLLAALTWLVDLLLYDEKAKAIKENSSDGELEYADAIFFDYISAAYSEFLAGNDEACSKLDAEFRVQFEEDNAQLARQVVELEARVMEQQAKLQMMTGEPSPLSLLESKKADFVNDITKFTSIIGNFQAHKEATVKKVEERKVNLEGLKVDIEKAAMENKDLRQRIEAQEISVAGVEKMDKESQILDSNLRALSSLAQDVEKEAWDCEVETSKMLRELEVVAASYNTATARLKDADDEVDAGQNVEFEVRVNSREDRAEDILGRDIKGKVRPALTALMENCERAIRDTKEGILQIQKQLYADEAALQERLERNTALKTHNKKVEAQYKSRKEKLEAYIALKAADRTELESQLQAKDTKLRDLNRHLEEELKECNAAFDELLNSGKDEMERYQAEVLEELQSYVEHKEFIQAGLVALERRADQTLASGKCRLPAASASSRTNTD